VDNGIRPSTRRHTITIDGHDQCVSAANLLDGDFLAENPVRNRQVISAISGLLKAGCTALVVIDLFSCRVIGWAASDRMKKVLAIRALDMAVRQCGSAPG
jgi:putative transposase